MKSILYLIFYTFYTFLENIVKMFIPHSWRAKIVADDIVLITGGGNGIGRELAIRFAKLGSTIVIWDIDKKGSETTAKQIKDIGGQVHTYVCDISNRSEIYKMAKIVKEEVGVVTILINNAGIFTGKSLLETPDDMIEKTFDINILAHFWTVKAFLPDMIKYSTGHIVTIASMAGFVGANMMVDYCASKHATVGFDEALHMELREMGTEDIITTVVCPYFMDTAMFKGVKSSFLPVVDKSYAADKITEGILINKHQITIPQYHCFGLFLKRLLPWKCYVFFVDSVVQINKVIPLIDKNQPKKEN